MSIQVRYLRRKTSTQARYIALKCRFRHGFQGEDVNSGTVFIEENQTVFDKLDMFEENLLTYEGQKCDVKSSANQLEIG